MYKKVLNIINLYVSGCENLRIFDGCWKLAIQHCMLAVPIQANNLGLPNVCTHEPAPNEVFCLEHLQWLVRHEIPTKKKEFLNHIGCTGKFIILIQITQIRVYLLLNSNNL